MKYVFAGVALIAIFLLILQGAPLFYYPPAAVSTPANAREVRTVELRGQTIRVSVADTESARRQGLSGRGGLEADEGMLFVFPEDGKYAFWMNDMSFSIDILWLSADGTVVYMAQNVSPDTYPRSFAPDRPARYVLELPAGYVKAYTVSTGDIVRL